MYIVPGGHEGQKGASDFPEPGLWRFVKLTMWLISAESSLQPRNLSLTEVLATTLTQTFR